MCGVVGYWPYNPKLEAESAFKLLFEESTIRGLHAFGILQGSCITRSFYPLDLAFNKTLPAIAHARYSTSGDWKDHKNNQPLVAGKYSLVFNGVISMETKAEMEQTFSVKLETENDGEIFLRCLEQGIKAEIFLSLIKGSFAGCWFEKDKFFVGRNARRPLWECNAYGAIWYASTRNIFKRAGFPEPIIKVLIGVHSPVEVYYDPSE